MGFSQEKSMKWTFLIWGLSYGRAIITRIMENQEIILILLEYIIERNFTKMSWLDDNYEY